ncbi:MAG: sensor histidine kinase, partial [Maribacter sp.]|uniref:sensor histidine kinase n=1 Tax=Maribacter sp. TaxID=1897614 RepID=UPI003C732F6A
YSIMTGIAIILLVSSLMGWFLYQQRQKRKNQQILTLKREQQVKTLESLMEGEEKERYRIAKDLHDGVNGDLSAIKYKLTAMVDHNATVVNEVVEMLDRSSAQVRAISHNLVPPALEKFNLVAALEDYTITMNDIHDPEIGFQHLGDPLNLSKNNEIVMYRIVQELVNNSVKHAKASEINIQLSHREASLQITVEDNGKGFDRNKKGGGIGLQNIESRVAYLNGHMDFVSNEKGTSYTVEIDLKKLNEN